MISAYKIGVSILATNGVSSVLRVIARDTLGLGKNIDRVTGRFGKWRVAALGVGAAVSMIGVAAVKAEFRLAKMGDELVRQQRLLRASGASRTEVGAATTTAERIAQTTKGVTPAESLQVIRELRTAIGSTPAAIKAAPSIMRNVAALQAFHIPGFQDATLQIVKALDLMGAGLKNGKFSASQFAKSFSSLTKMEILAGGLIPPSTLMRFSQLGGFVGQISGDPTKFLQQSFALLMQMGTRAGSGLAQMVNQLVGGQASTKSIFGMLDMYHLLKPGGFENIYGHFWVKPGGLVGYNQLVKNGPLSWLTNVLLPHLRAQGVKTPAQMIQAISMLMSSIRSARDVYAMLLPASHALYERDLALTKRAMGSHPYSQAFNTLGGAETGVGRAWNGLLQVAGATIVPTVVKYLNMLTSGLQALQGVVARHPAATKAVLKVIGAIGVALVALGATAVITALVSLVGPTGLIVGLAAGLVALAAAFGKLKWVINFFKSIFGPSSKALSKQLGQDAKNTGFIVDPASGMIIPLQDWHNSGRNAIVPMPPAHGSSRSSAPVPVHVVNGKDIADGVTKHQAKGLQANPSTPTAHNPRRGFFPPGLASMPVPGL